MLLNYFAMCICRVVDKALPHTVSTDASLGSALSHSMNAPHKSMSLDLDNLSHPMTDLNLAAADVTVSRARRSGRSPSTQLTTDVQVVVAWLESFEDYLTFPIGKSSSRVTLPWYTYLWLAAEL